MGNCKSDNRVYIGPDPPKRPNAYAVDTSGDANKPETEPSTPSPLPCAGNGVDFTYHNLEDLKDARSDAVEVPLYKPVDNWIVEEFKDVDPSKDMESAEGKLKEYKMELKKKVRKRVMERRIDKAR